VSGKASRPRENGTIVKIIEDRGFGFIRPAGSQGGGKVKDIFFHVRALPPNTQFDEQLVERRVQFETEQSDKGPRAINVDLL
jgi:cold shock CspA family protein